MIAQLMSAYILYLMIISICLDKEEIMVLLADFQEKVYNGAITIFELIRGLF